MPELETAKLTNLFASPFMIHVWSDGAELNEALRARIFDHKQTSAGEDKTNVDEYCVSEGWVRLALGDKRDRRGKPLTIKLSGPVEPYFRNG